MERTQITSIGKEREDTTIDPKDIKKIIKEHFDQFYAHKSDNQNEIDQLLKRHNPPKHKQEETDDLNRLILLKILSQKLINFPNRKHQIQMRFTGEFYQNLRKKLYQFSIISFEPPIKGKGLDSNSFYESSITIILKPNTLQKKNKNYGSIFLIDMKILNKK